MNVEELSKDFEIDARNLRENPPSQEAAGLLDHDLASKLTILPLDKKGNRLWVAMSDPLNYDVIADLYDLTGLFIEPVLSAEQDIRYFINQLYSSAQIETITSQFLVEENIRKFEYQLDAELRKQLQSAPVVKLVDSLIESAFLCGASDIHIEPYEHTLRARFRIDGQLANPQIIKQSMLPNVISRLKIMASLNIMEKRLPQDGHFSLKVSGEAMDFRLSTMPTLFGEKAVIRLLYNQDEHLGIEQLGFFTKDLIVLDRLFQNPHGAVIITGPTGSGKTTTLTGFMSVLNKIGTNIVTVEDPVENPIEGVNHVAVDPKAGLDFPRALRHILRQDPDVIMVGEIRDPETAAIAAQAAITGHLVLSTVHTNDAAGVFPRFVDMGVEPFMVAAALNGVIAQRLVRRLCRFCKEKQLISKFNQTKTIPIPVGSMVYTPNGCNQCGNTGYKSRFALYEYVIINDAMRRDMAENEYNLGHVENIMRGHCRPIVENGIENILMGNTSVDEVMRAVYRE